MTTKTVHVHIPAEDYDKQVFVASDGQEFDTENQCRYHERNIMIEQHRVYKTRIVSDDLPCNPFREDSFVMYYLQDEADLEFLLDLLQPHELYAWKNEFHLHGPGWYLHWYEYSHDDDTDDINHLDSFKGMQLTWVKWVQEVEAKTRGEY